MSFLKDLFGSSDEKEKEKSSPKISYKKITEPGKIGRSKGRKPRGLQLDEDFELKNKQTLGGKALDSLKQSGRLDPADIEKIASNLQGQGAKRRKKKDLIGNLIDEILKGNSIDLDSLDNDQQNELRERLDEGRTPTTRKDLERGADELAGMDKDIIPKTTRPSVTEPSITEPSRTEPSRTAGGYLGDNIEENLEGREAGRTRDDDKDGIPNYQEQNDLEGREAGRTRDDDKDGIPNYQEQNDLETTQEHHEAIEDKTILDQTLDFKHLGGSRTGFDSNFIRFILNSFVKKSVNFLASRVTGLPDDITNIVNEPVVNSLPSLYNYITGGGEKEYKRLSIHDKHSPFTNATIPIICITLYLYLVDRANDFRLSINLLDTVLIRYTLTKLFNFDNSSVDYSIKLFRLIPDELRTAYLKQKGSMINEITVNESIKIKQFIDRINIDYRVTFNKSLKEDLFAFENKQSLYLYEMIETLNTPNTLFEFSSAFNTMNELIKEMVNNPYLIVQLMALIYEESEDKNLATSDILSRGKVDRLIYYYGDKIEGVKEDAKVSVLKNMSLDMNKRGKVKGMTVIENSDKVALYKYKDRYYVSFRGTNVKDEKDIRNNFLNFGGKDLLNNIEYNDRIVLGKTYLDLAINKSKQEGLEPPAVLGYSLGGVSSMYLATLYPNIETDVYAPILSRSDLTENIMDYLGNSNIHFNYSEKDPISKNMEYYRMKHPNLDINKYRNNKFYSPHNLEQFN